MARIRDISRDEQIPTEQKLSEELGVNRFLLRQVIEDLVREGILYRIPRHGTYMRDQTVKTVGIVQEFCKTDGYCNMPLILSGICEVLADNACLIRFVNPKDEQELPMLIQRYMLDVCIVCTVDHPDAPRILGGMASEIRKKVILISASPYNLSLSLHENYVEHSPFGAERISSIVQAGGKRIVLITDSSQSQVDMIASIHEHKSSWKKSWHLENAAQIKMRLPQIILKDKIDAILVDSGAGMLGTLYSVLETAGEFTPIICVTHGGRLKKIQEQHPDVKAKYLYFDYDNKALGIAAANMAVTICRTGAAQPPVLVRRTIFQ